MRPDFHSWDDKIDDEVSQLLRIHVEVDTTNIQLEVDEGEVRLLGSVPENEMRMIAEDLVSRSPGVRRVMNYLIIKRDETICP